VKDALVIAGLLDGRDVEMIEGSRRGSLQMAHGSTSVMLLQVEQRKTFDLTSRIALASASASAGGRLRM
jgi:hypothetical protein